MKETGRQDPAMNALKHGILARAVVVTGGLTGDTQESQAQFDAILADLVEHYNPHGPVEAMLVEQIAVHYWRLRRVLWAEAAQCAERVTRATREAIEETEHLDDQAGELLDRADAIRRRRKLTRAEKAAYGAETPEDVAGSLEVMAAMKERQSKEHFNRKAQFNSAPAFEEQSDTRNRYEAHLNRMLYKAITKLEEMQAARIPQGRGTTKPRRGASKAKPAFLHVVGK